MARAKSSEQPRSRPKAPTAEEFSRGIGKLQDFLSQVEDLGREGFPYLDAARARTEIQFRECVRRIFGDKSPEFQEHRQHKLLMGSPEETQRSIALIKTLITALEQKKRDLQGGASPLPKSSAPAAAPISARPHMTLVPPAIPTVQVTMMQTAPIAPPPIIMSVAMTTHLDQPTTDAAPAPPTPAPSPSPASSEQESPKTALPPPNSAPASLAQTPVAVTQPAPSPRQVPSPVAPPLPSATPAHQMPQSAPVTAQPPMPSASTSTQTTAAQSFPAESDPLELAKTLCCRFHAVARQLRLRGEYRATLSVEDEFDTQDLLHAILRVQFDDIGIDEWTPSYTSGSPRTTFLLNDGRLAVVVKKTRPGLNAKDLTDQLQIDAERYRSHGRCTRLLCFIYDPEGRIGNPRGLETNLTSVSDTFIIDVLVSPK